MSDSAELPSVTFSSFITTLASSAMVSLGMAPDPASQAKSVNLDLARYSIDCLAVLEGKTSGNLDAEEKQLLESLLFELRTKFVEVSKAQRG